VSDDHHFMEVLTRRGYELHFVIPKPEATSDLPFEPVFVHTYPNFFRATEGWPTAVRRIVWPALFNLVVTARTLSLVRTIKPDFILGHSHYSALPCFAARKLCRVPAGVKLFGVMDLVHTEWSKWKYYSKNFEQIVALKMPQDVWIILDDGTKGRDAAIRHGVPPDKIRFLPNGINIEWADGRYEKKRMREAIGVPDDCVVALFLARLVASKRPEMFIEAARIVVRRTKRPVVFLVAGDGESREECETLARSLGLDDTARFIGTVEHSRVPEVMAASDLFVSTSRLTNVAIPTCEAMVCGLPVIGFDVGTTRDIIDQGQTGFVVPDGDVNALADAVATLVENDTLRRRMGEEARARAKRIFTGWDARIGEEIAIIEGFMRRTADER
jgi:glycosyltransferase involved in cell wall biosynthesis